MNVEWIVIESAAIAIENFMFLYFLHNRFNSKSSSVYPQLFTYFILVMWGLISTFIKIPIYDFMNFGILLGYLLIFKQGSIPQKLIGVIILWSIVTASTLAGASLAALLTDTHIANSYFNQDTSRLLAIILIKAIQVIILYLLAKRHLRLRDIQKRAVQLSGSLAALDFVCLLLLYRNMQYFNTGSSHMILWLAMGLLFIIIGVFVIYEMFVLEEVKNMELQANFQRLELEARFQEEMDVIYDDMRKWKHEYKRIMVPLKAYIGSGEIDDAMALIDSIDNIVLHDTSILQSGNLILDAVVSSKLKLAKSRGIKISLQVVYPEGNPIEDKDLCSIIGNLLDNAIEACERISDKSAVKYIDFSIFFKKQSLFISIINSFDGNVNVRDDKYLTVKPNRFSGIGIPYIQKIVDKYYGHMIFRHERCVFRADVMLPLIEKVR